MKTLTFFKKNLYNRLITFFMRQGAKSKIKKSIDLAFKALRKLTKVSSAYLLAVIFTKLNVFVEVKDLSVRRSTYPVPFTLTLTRRVFLITSWILKAIHQNKKNSSIQSKLILELLSLFKTDQSKVFEYKKANNKKAYKNRSNMHYRW